MNVRLALSVIASAMTAVALYAVVRVIQKLLFPEADPALVIWSPHAGFFWRAWTCGYVGVMIGFATWVVAGRDPGRVARLLAKGVVVATVLIVAQGILVP